MNTGQLAYRLMLTLGANYVYATYRKSNSKNKILSSVDELKLISMFISEWFDTSLSQ